MAADTAYRRWRDAKLAAAPTELSALVVEVEDPRRLTPAQHDAILERCQRANMAIYVGKTGDDPDKAIPTALGSAFGLHRLDHNRGADEDAITSLTVQTDTDHRDFIPYSNRPIAWHTDGYYNAPEQQIRGLLLHCVHPAADGGANDLLDHEIAYILVRDQSPDYIRALMHPDCMTIPASYRDGEQVRPDRTGPVFSVSPSGRLHMRYTNRPRNVVWRNDPLTTEAVAYLKDVLHRDTPWHLSGRLESGWGLISTNVLHTRSGFTDGATPRLLYRARYYDEMALG
nr:TauD/TfdA family dioxygenase [Halochromatium glycolicum]